MIRVAILGSQLVGQLANEGLGSEVDVVWKGVSAEAFRRDFHAFIRQNNLPGLLASLSESPDDTLVAGIAAARPGIAGTSRSALDARRAARLQ